MPKVNHPNIGNVLLSVYLPADIIAIDAFTDRAEVNFPYMVGIIPSPAWVPIVYHCQKFADVADLRRGTDAVYGAACPFKVGDQVIVRCGIHNDFYRPMQIIGFADKAPRSCKKDYLVAFFTIPTVSPDPLYYVWDIKDNNWAVLPRVLSLETIATFISATSMITDSTSMLAATGFKRGDNVTISSASNAENNQTVEISYVATDGSYMIVAGVLIDETGSNVVLEASSIIQSYPVTEADMSYFLANATKYSGQELWTSGSMLRDPTLLRNYTNVAGDPNDPDSWNSYDQTAYTPSPVTTSGSSHVTNKSYSINAIVTGITEAGTVGQVDYVKKHDYSWQETTACDAGLRLSCQNGSGQSDLFMYQTNEYFKSIVFESISPVTSVSISGSQNVLTYLPLSTAAVSKRLISDDNDGVNVSHYLPIDEWFNPGGCVFYSVYTSRSFVQVFLHGILTESNRLIVIPQIVCASTDAPKDSVYYVDDPEWASPITVGRNTYLEDSFEDFLLNLSGDVGSYVFQILFNTSTYPLNFSWTDITGTVVDCYEF